MSLQRCFWSVHRCALRIYAGMLLCGLLCVCGGCVGSPSAQRALPTPTAAQQKATFDPCILFSKSAASQVLAENVEVQPNLTAALCTYHSNTPAKSVNTQREILVASGSSSDAKGYFTLEQAQAKHLTMMQTVPGIGDAAFAVKLSVGQSIVVLQSTTIYSITIIYPLLSTTEMQQDLQRLARLAEGVVTSSAPTLVLPDVHPCQLVTADEARQTLQRRPVQSLFTNNDAGVASCDYLSPLDVHDRVLVVVNSNPAAREMFTAAQSQASSQQAISGLGDAAFFDGYDTIWVLKGKLFFHITVLGVGQQEKIAERLARKAVGRI